MFRTSVTKFVTFLVLGLCAILWVAPEALAANGPSGYGPGRVGLSILAGREHVDIGGGGIWNSRYQLIIQLDPADDWRIQEYYLDMGYDNDGEVYQPPLTVLGNPLIGFFDYKEEFELPYCNDANVDGHPFRRTFTIDLEEDLGFKWGTPYAEMRTQGIAIFMNLVKLDDEGNITERTGAWVVPELITWLEEEEVEADETTVEVEDDIVADAWTGELTDKNAIYIESTKKGTAAVIEQQSAQQGWEVDEAEEVVAFDGGRWGWWFRFTMGHPKTGHFVDSPVQGLYVETPTYEGMLLEDAKFDYFPGENADVYLGSVLLGSPLADHKVSPLDIFPSADTDDIRVANMARLLQSLDLDGEPKGGILITPEVVGAFDQAVEYFGLTDLDWADELHIENVILKTHEFAALLDPPVTSLVLRDLEEARGHLNDTMNNAMFRKRVSRTPGLGSSKAKMNVSTVWQPALPANADETTRAEALRYYDENGAVVKEVSDAKPLVVTFTDADPETGEHDVWAAISRDDGHSWKRKNISRSADRTSFTLGTGQEYFGGVKKPVFQVKGNKILIAWTSKYAHGGKPRYSIKTDDDYTYDDAYAVEDIWGVAGPQRSHNYVEDGFPEVGEIPYSAVWTCRGIIVTQADLDKGIGRFVGDIVWFKPERLTSGRRDALQLFCGAASSVGFAIVWQEDPDGLRPGKAAGPGEGWSGATTNHKTDIWYSYVTWADHSKIDTNFVSGGDPQHDLDVLTRPKVLVPMSLPMRVSDNDNLNRKNMGLDDSSQAEDVAFTEENLTRCVKFEGGKSIMPADDPNAYLADYPVLRLPPEDHYPSMNCTNCHVPWGLDPHSEDAPTQGSPIPLVVVDAETLDYLGGYNNGDCVSCHYSYIVPRDRVIAMTPSLDELAKCDECLSKGGLWKDGTDGTEVLEAYYPYDGYPYLFDPDYMNDGTHRYGQEVEGLLSGEYYTFINNAGDEKSVAITTDGRLLDGDTGASRPNIFMQAYVSGFKPDGTEIKSAWAIVTYEETKGAGSGPPDPEDDVHSDDYSPEEGKNVIYHSFDFKNPDYVNAGNIVNPPEYESTLETDAFGNEISVPVLDANGDPVPKYLVDEFGDQILDWKGRPQLAYENARRGRLVLQGPGAIKSTRTIMAMVYKMGERGHGRPSDIFMSRWVVPTTDDPMVDNPYRFENAQGDRVYDPLSEQEYWVRGPKNMSSVTPTVTTPSMGDPESDDPYGAVKVVEWKQGQGNFEDLSFKNRFDDSRAHRGQLRGDFMVIGFSYCPNWAASRNGNDNYDFYVRRSFDGGQTFTTDPVGDGVTHSYVWTYPSGTESAGTKVEEVNTYAAGEFESMRNLSKIKNNKSTVIEPRIVAVPGTIKVNGAWTKVPEDKQNQNVYYVAWGTATNPKKDPITKEQDASVPEDLYYSFSRNKGEGYYEKTWVVNPDSDGNNAGETVTGWDWLARGEAQSGEVQLRCTPDGSRMYASWLEEGPDGSDVMFRRIMSAEFPQNVAPVEETAAEDVVAEEATIDPTEDVAYEDDINDESGGD